MNFKNEPFTDFSLPEHRYAMEQALVKVRAMLGQTYPLVINGRPVKTRRTLASVNPSKSSEIVGRASDANAAQAGQALEAAARAFELWKRVSQDERAQALRRMATALRQRKFEFCAWLIFEVGKNWAEADADVGEAIDFLNYYAERSLTTPAILTPLPSELNTYHYRPLGPVVVIPPWNFPLAILVGMTSAAIATGNTVVLKPSSQSPVIAAKFTELAQDAGLPPGVLNLITGSGATIGDSLVREPRTRMIAFTGSRSVGLHINALAAQTPPKQRWIKRVIAEMGGKNAIIVDASADLEQAAQGVLASAFGYQGQKCSACSRLFVHQSVYSSFVEKLMQKVRAIRQGPAEIRDNFMGPVISQSAMKGILKYAALGKKEGRQLSPSPQPSPHGRGNVLKNSLSLGERVQGEGFFIPPTIFDHLPRRSRLWQEEIFGPILAVASVKDFEEGLQRANDTVYGLTGAIYSDDPANVKLARESFFCGNLYINRKCTGAMVGGHPFGGFDMSGTDSKAGGPDYLQLFWQAQCISQKF